MDKDGVMHPMSFPPEDSDHERLSHFYINSITGLPFDEISPDMRQFPIEKAAMILARELVQQGKATEAEAMQEARRIFNEATMRFNRIKRENGDDFHTLPIPFDDDGSLHPEYKNNHYSNHENRRVPTSQRRTRTEDGKLINNHKNNKAHTTLGHHLESAALHIHKELLEELEKRGVQSTIGARQNVIEPQQITGGVTHRYSSNDADPTSKDNTRFPSHYADQHRAMSKYGDISPFSIVSLLPGDFFQPTSSGGMSTSTMRRFMEMGIDQQTARDMARAPINQLLYGRGKKGSATALRNVMDRMAAQLDLQNPEIQDIYIKHRGHFTPRVKNEDRGKNQAAIDIMAMLKTAEEIGIDPRNLSTKSAPPPSVRDGYIALASQDTKQITMEELGLAEDSHEMRGKINNNYDHLYDNMPKHISYGGIGAEQESPEPLLPPQGPLETLPSENETQLPLEGDPLATEGGSAGAATEPDFPPSGGFGSPFGGFGGYGGFQPPTLKSDDPMGVIAKIMERVQLHDAGGSTLRKYDPMDNYDMQKLGGEVGMSSIDVRAIAMSLGDWGIIAKSFNTTPDVVRAIKKSCGGAVNG